MTSRQIRFARLLQECRTLVVVGTLGLLASCSHEAPLSQLDASVDQSVVTKSTVRSTAHLRKKPTHTATSQPLVVRLKTRTRQVAYGRGPYICSPSGFGRTSRCVAR